MSKKNLITTLLIIVVFIVVIVSTIITMSFIHKRNKEKFTNNISDNNVAKTAAEIAKESTYKGRVEIPEEWTEETLIDYMERYLHVEGLTVIDSSTATELCDTNKFKLTEEPYVQELEFGNDATRALSYVASNYFGDKEISLCSRATLADDCYYISYGYDNVIYYFVAMQLKDNKDGEYTFMIIK